MSFLADTAPTSRTGARRLPSGWWIAPVVMGGAGIWGLVIMLIVNSTIGPA
jgi:hypothetical protein